MSAEALNKINHDPKDPSSLGVVSGSCSAPGSSMSQVSREKTVQEYFKSEQAYTLHKPARRQITRNHTYVATIDTQWQADLADMQGIAKQNGGMKYLLTVIDVFFKFAWAVPVHSKGAKAITVAFGQLLTTANPCQPKRLQTDKGKEFFNSNFQTLMKPHNIQHFASESEQKAVVVERFNRTIKTRIWTYLSDRGTVRWVDIIQDLVDAYNHSRHRSIGMAPVDVQKMDENRLWVRLFGGGDTHFKPQIPQGAMVWASSHETIFDKCYMPNLIKEHFTVSKAVPPRKRTKRRIYKLMDYNDETVKGSWYPEEIQEIFRQPVPYRESLVKAYSTWRHKKLFVR